MNAESRDPPPFDLRERTKRFAVLVIRFAASLPNSPEAWVVRRQVCRSGTSVGAQYREACRARSPAEFVSKMESALQELDETQYWLEIAEAAGMTVESPDAPIRAETDELIRIFVASAKTAKSR
jgi:four helix bundle protein